MTYRHVCNETEKFTRHHVRSQTVERQKDGTTLSHNSPYNVNFESGGQVVFRGREHRPCGAEQSGNLPIWMTPIPDLQFVVDVEITPYDVSQHCLANIPTTYTITTLPPGLTMDTAGVISGTPTNIGSASPFVTASNAKGSSNSNSFNISIVAP